jgi:hypothetical protein
MVYGDLETFIGWVGKEGMPFLEIGTGRTSSNFSDKVRPGAIFTRRLYIANEICSVCIPTLGYDNWKIRVNYLMEESSSFKR